MIYEPFDIVSVHFPFSDKKQAKKRPALVISSDRFFGPKINHTVLLMITATKNKPWPLDIEIKNLKETGLAKSSIIRMKSFTLDNRIIIEKIGTLATIDQKKVCHNFVQLFKEVFDKI